MAKSMLAQLVGLLYDLGLSHNEVGRILSCMTSAHLEEIAEERSIQMGACMQKLHQQGKLMDSDLMLLAKLVEERVTSLEPTE